MAINLNPGADSTLVGAAYRAAAGNKPGDYSRALEKAAEGYSKTMEASSEMWGKIGALGAAIGIEAVGNAQKQIEALALGDTLNPEKAGLFLEDFENIKGELRGLGMFSGRFGDKQTRIDRAGLMAKKKKLFAEIEGHVTGLADGVGRVASGDFKIISPADDIVVGEMVNAIVKSNLKDNITGQGNEARLNRNETTGDLTYTMYKDNQPVLDSNQAPITMTMSQFSEAIANNTSDGGAKVLEFNKYTDKVYDRGLKSKTGEYDDSMKQADLNWVDTQIEKKADLKRAMNMTFGYSNTSFYDDITKNKNEYSSGLFGELLSIKGGEVLTGEITAGMIDKDGEAGISADEAMDKENYAMLTENLLGLKDENLTKAYFKDYVVKELEKTNDLGRSNKPPVPGSGTDETDDEGDKYGGFGQFRVKTGGGGGTPVSITSATALQRRAYLNDFGQVDGEHGQYIWNKDLGDNGMYVRDDGEEMSMFEVARDEGLIKPSEGKGDFNPTRSAAANKEGENLSKGLASPSMLQSTGSMGSQDNAAANKLNNTFKFTSVKDSDYFFTPYTSNWQGQSGTSQDNMFTNDIMLIDGSTNKPVKDSDGNVKRFGTGGDYSENDLKWINDFLGEYASKQQQADDTTTYTQN